MTLIRPPFTDTGKQTGHNTMRLRLNDEERDMISKAQRILNQSKAGTTMKQLAKIGYANVVSNPQTVNLLDIIYNNKRRNERNGIIEYEDLE